jgi:hypothetical protein
VRPRFAPVPVEHLDSVAWLGAAVHESGVRGRSPAEASSAQISNRSASALLRFGERSRPRGQPAVVHAGGLALDPRAQPRRQPGTTSPAAPRRR